MEAFFKIVDSLELSKELKAELSDRSFAKAHHLYINLCEYIRPAFPGIDTAKAESLSLSGYLYFRFLLSLDSFIDESNVDAKRREYSFQKLLVAFEFYEKSIQGLTDLFGSSNVFWSHFSQLKKQYYDSVIFEKKISASRPLIDDETFIKLAAGKSAVCSAMVHALGSVSGSEKNVPQIIELLKTIHVALQYVDDLEDFKVDIAEGQWTQVQSQIQEYLKIQGLEPSDPAKNYKHLFLSGIASNSMRKAVEKLDHSIAMANELSLNALAAFLEKKREAFDKYRKDIQLVIDKTKVKTTKTDELFKRGSVGEAIRSGIVYLEGCLEDDGRWTDFLTSVGFGKDWITAYVGFQLAEIGNSHDLARRSLGSLQGKQSNSFNDSILQDGDSTTFVNGFFSRMQHTISEFELSQWLRFMNNDGGWVTYRDEEALIRQLGLNGVSVGGWTSAKLCVTAAAAYVLSGMKNMEAEYELSCNYLVNHVSDNKFWESYWWSSPVYATAFAVMALSPHHTYRRYAGEACEWLVETQTSEGYWKNEILNKSSPFYTALAFKALAVYDVTQYRRSIAKAAGWLMDNQAFDGSWLTNRILRIPATNVENPGKVGTWKLKSLGVNTLVDDHNRVFTTSTVVNALGFVEKLGGGIFMESQRSQINPEAMLTN